MSSRFFITYHLESLPGDAGNAGGIQLFCRFSFRLLPDTLHEIRDARYAKEDLQWQKKFHLHQAI
jgi:hypothetical protein